MHALFNIILLITPCAQVWSYNKFSNKLEITFTSMVKYDFSIINSTSAGQNSSGSVYPVLFCCFCLHRGNKKTS